jgi:hypothetical protein
MLFASTRIASPPALWTLPTSAAADPNASLAFNRNHFRAHPWWFECSGAIPANESLEG